MVTQRVVVINLRPRVQPEKIGNYLLGFAEVWLPATFLVDVPLGCQDAIARFFELHQATINDRPWCGRQAGGAVISGIGAAGKITHWQFRFLVQANKWISFVVQTENDWEEITPFARRNFSRLVLVSEPIACP